MKPLSRLLLAVAVAGLGLTALAGLLAAARAADVGADDKDAKAVADKAVAFLRATPGQGRQLLAEASGRA